MGLVITLGPALGPALSGVIISMLGWHYIFWFSAVIYVVLTLFAAAKMANVSEITKPRIDFLSIVLSTIGFGGLIYALAVMAEISFASPKLWTPLLAEGIALPAKFHDKPMIHLGVFKHPMFTLGTVMMFLSILVILSTGILLPIYLKESLLFSTAAAGLLLLPGNAVNVIMSPIVGTLFDKRGPKKLVIAGSMIVLIGNLIFAAVISASTPARLYDSILWVDNGHHSITNQWSECITA
ncbi:MFS transporter [Neobacillus mesonae]|uniref:MFS transporter n=1 Tax=Neobacillus mesonae TaxID=1193713 RepID=UPI00204239FD|nr:MFS transporter [Neobacillus mesonae]MCM3567250.1 MFS transporter [Neobacillus mesonae]